MAKDNRRRNKKRINDNYEPQGDPKALATALDDLGLSEKTVGILKDGGIATARDLAKRRMSEMYRIRYVGRRECNEVANALRIIGLAYREEPEKAEGAEQEKKGVSENRGDNKNAQTDQKQQKPQKQQNVAGKQQGPQGKQHNQQKQDKNPKNKQIEKQQDKNGRPKYDYKPYDNVSLYELVYGKRERPVAEKPQKEQLTPDSIVKFCRQGKWGYKDWKGNVLIKPVYDDAYSFHEDRACVEKDGLLGYIDRKNQLVIDYKYDSATSFSEGLAAVSIGEKSGYIDKDGAEVLPMEFDVATAFENGKAIVRQDGRWGVLDRETLKVLWR